MAASYGAPGVYIEEQPSGSMPIEGVGTAVAAFVGFTETYDSEQGDPTDPTASSRSWSPAGRSTSGSTAASCAARCCRTPCAASSRTAAAPRTSAGSPTRRRRRRRRRQADADPARRRQPEHPEPAAVRRATRAPSSRSRSSRRRPPPPAEGEGDGSSGNNGAGEYTLRVYEGGALREELGGLQFSGRSARTVEKTVNERSKFVRIEMQPLQGASLAERTPAAGRYTLQAPPVVRPVGHPGRPGRQRVPTAPATRAWRSPRTSPWWPSPT